MIRRLGIWLIVAPYVIARAVLDIVRELARE
jgi:hypothetical protein